MEFQFQNFLEEYNHYNRIEENIQETLLNPANDQRADQLQVIYNEFKNLDVKMRLAFGIHEIRLNNDFVQDKEGDLKMCHLLYYKLADLWFAYETYLKLFQQIIGTGKHKISWLNTVEHNDYTVDAVLVNTLNIVNDGFRATYDTPALRDELSGYLNYCLAEASKPQKRGLLAIIAKIGQIQFVLTHTEVLTIIYAIRNNFVHNGETTVVPAIFGYRNKSALLRILYPYLCLVLLRSVNITCRRIPEFVDIH